jgi:hypothetical protein
VDTGTVIEQSCRPRPALTLLLGLVILLGLFPGEASAADFRGKTQQGYFVRVGDNRSEHMNYFDLIFAARCDDGTGMRSTDELVIREIELSEPRHFVDYETFTYEGQRGTFRVEARTAGRKENPKHWAGTFKARVTQHWRGELLRTCWTGVVQWGARRRDY